VSQIAVVLEGARDLENRLRRLGAQGRGLHQLATSVESRLDSATIKRLRFIATVRNKIVHEANVDARQIEAWTDAVRAAKADLGSIRHSPTSEPATTLMVIALAVVIAIGAAVWHVLR
jgi:hypothetical protein